MAWVRLHDDAVNHPKILKLSDKAFRLWIWGLSYCQRHLTDGLVSTLAIPPRLNRAHGDLVACKLWDATPDGYRVHDYLDWNDSRETVLRKRNEAKDRMADARDRRVQERRSREHINGTSREVLRGVGTKNSSLEEIDSAISERAGRFVELYGELYAKHCKGAKWLRRQPNLDWGRAIKLCQQWDDSRLEKLAVIFLTTDDDWISKTDRGFAVFESRATWCDQRLAAWESQQNRSAS